MAALGLEPGLNYLACPALAFLSKHEKPVLPMRETEVEGRKYLDIVPASSLGIHQKNSFKGLESRSVSPPSPRLGPCFFLQSRPRYLGYESFENELRKLGFKKLGDSQGASQAGIDVADLLR